MVRIPKQRYPKGLQRDYASDLLAVARRTRVELRPLMTALPGILRAARADVLHRDADDDDEADTEALIAAAIAALLLYAGSVARGVATKAARRIAKHNRVQFGKQLQSALGIGLPKDSGALLTTIEGFVAENVALIKSIPAQTVSEIEGIVLRGVTAGGSHADIAKEINKRLKIGERRAKLIARDQVGKLYGAINSKLQRDAGVTHFFWQELGDDRVRPLHRSLGGQRFSWKAGAPGEGLPGQPINCRCWGEPDFSTLL